MNEQAFIDLNQHLNEVYPSFDEFCCSTNYERANPKSLGRYPRIRVQKEIDSVIYWMELWMALDENGRRYEKYFDGVPYDFSAGAYFNLDDGSKHGQRYQKSFNVFSNKAFSDIPSCILSTLNEAREKIESWNREFLKENGENVKLG